MLRRLAQLMIRVTGGLLTATGLGFLTLGAKVTARFTTKEDFGVVAKRMIQAGVTMLPDTQKRSYLTLVESVDRISQQADILGESVTVNVEVTVAPPGKELENA